MPDYQLTRGSTDELFMTVTRGAVKAKDLLGNQSLICCFFCQGISLRESLGNFSKTPINVKTKNHETKLLLIFIRYRLYFIEETIICDEMSIHGLEPCLKVELAEFTILF